MIRGRGNVIARRALDERCRDADVCLWTISEAARATGVSRDMIRQATKIYEASRGAMGLAFVRLTATERVRMRKTQVLEWIEEMERKAAHR